MDDLVSFLRARLDEDEQVARAAAELRLRWGLDAAPDGTFYVSPGRHTDDLGNIHEIEAAVHIARWDPVRALAEVDAKRLRIQQHRKFVDHNQSGLGREHLLAEAALALSLKFDALVYADHPDYREEWRPVSAG